MRKLVHIICFFNLFLLSLNGQIIINEIMYNPPEAGNDRLEYIELYNTTNSVLSLKDYIIDDAVNIIFPDTFINPKSYFLICGNAAAFDSVFGIKALEWTSGALRNDNEVITLKDQNGIPIDSVHYYDVNGWPALADGNGSSLELCRTTADNSRSEYWKGSTTNTNKTIDGLKIFATPGKANNVECANYTIESSDFTFTPNNLEIFVGEHVEWKNASGTHNVNASKATFPNNPEGFINGTPTSGNWTFIKRFDLLGEYNYQCDQHPNQMKGKIIVKPRNSQYPSYPVGLISSVNNNGEVDSLNVQCQLEGVVHGINFRPAGLQFVLIDKFDDGIVVFNANANFSYTVKEGDRIAVRGTVIQFNGLIEIQADTIIKIATNNTLSTAQPILALSENTEAQLVKIRNAQLVNPVQWTNNPLGFTVKVTNGIANFDIRIDNDCDLLTKEPPSGTFDITGLGWQNDPSSPYNDGYQLMPRYTADISPYIPASKFYPKYGISKVTGFNPSSGVADSIGTKCELKGVVYGIDYLGTTGLQFTIIDPSDGIGVFSATKNFGYTVKEGDEVTVQGKIEQFRGLTQINLDTLWVNSSNNTLKTPTITTVLDENTESNLVKMNNMIIVNPSDWIGGGAGFNVRISNGTKEFVMRIDDNTDIANTALGGNRVNVTGIGSQFDATNPFTEDYQIVPRYVRDLSFSTSNQDLNPGADVQLSPQPCSDYVYLIGKINDYSTVHILSLDGKLLESKTIDSKLDIQLQSGIYALQLIGDHKQKTLKLMVK